MRSSGGMRRQSATADISVSVVFLKISARIRAAFYGRRKLWYDVFYESINKHKERRLCIRESMCAIPIIMYILPS